ncbi:MAG: hypothetical protein KC505_03015 [Myxococcales bacterium]|nr:hypothetical protein [Myxococcales bacterium]
MISRRSIGFISELAFATVKLRTRNIKGSGSVKMAEAMALKLLLEAEKRWRKSMVLSRFQQCWMEAFTKMGY